MALTWSLVQYTCLFQAIRRNLLRLSILSWLCIRDYSNVEYSCIEEYFAMNAYLATLPPPLPQPVVAPSKKQASEIVYQVAEDEHLLKRPLNPATFSKLRGRNHTNTSQGK